jgi:DNA replication protein DnaC
MHPSWTQATRTEYRLLFVQRRTDRCHACFRVRSQRFARGGDASGRQWLPIDGHYDVGSNGVGKTTLAKNIAHQAIIAGHTVLFTTAGQLLGDLAAIDSDAALRRRLHHYAAADFLAIDEIGYLSYSNRHADLLFELLNRRYESKSTLVTTNKPFAAWPEMFPNAGCVVSLVDRLVHRSEVIAIEGESYRLKEAQERSERNARLRRTSKTTTSKE